MIIQQCDICKRETAIYDTIILYKKPIDYCVRCKNTITRIKQMYQNEVKKQLTKMDKILIEAENKSLKNGIKEAQKK
ncbi:MAG: hypothetical protein IKF38_04860 [Clostridia bacterium]|nr:hypothetical protein [Clostridia bacterium]